MEPYKEVRKQELLKSMDLMVYTLKEDPLSLKEAIFSLNVELWQEAINNEMNFLESNKT